MLFSKYFKTTGEINFTGACSPDSLMPLQENPEYGVIEGHYKGATQFFDLVAEEVVSRPIAAITIDKTEIIADETDTATISGLLNDTQIIIPDYGAWVVTDNEFVFTVDLPGEYIIKCRNFPYQDKEFVVNAVEP